MLCTILSSENMAINKRNKIIFVMSFCSGWGGNDCGED